MLFQFLRERLANLFPIAKPAFQLLDERLNVTASGNIEISTTPLLHLVKHHGRFEIAVLCAVIENVACLVLLQNYGIRGAVKRTFPVIGARTQDIFFAISVFVLNYLTTFSLKASRHFENISVMKVALKMKKPILASIFILHCIVRLLFGEDYLSSTIVFFKALPGYVFNFAKAEFKKRLYRPCMRKVHEVQRISPVFAFSCRRFLELAVIIILGVSVFFAFVSVYALDETSLVTVVDEEHSQAFIIDAEGDGGCVGDDADMTLNDTDLGGNRMLKIAYIEDNIDKAGILREEWEEVEAGQEAENGGEEEKRVEVGLEEKEEETVLEKKTEEQVCVEEDAASINACGSSRTFPSMESITCFSEEESIQIAADITIAMSEDILDIRDIIARVDGSANVERETSVVCTKEEQVKVSKVSFEPRSHTRPKASSLDTLMDIRPISLRDQTCGLTPYAPTFVPRLAKMRAPWIENDPPHCFPPFPSNGVPVYWAPAPAVPVAVNTPRRPAKLGTRRTRYISLMGIPLKDRPQAVGAKF